LRLCWVGAAGREVAMDHPFACPRGVVHDVAHGWEVMEPWLRRNQPTVEPGSEELHSYLYRTGQLLVSKDDEDAVRTVLSGRARTDQEPADDDASRCLDALGLTRVRVEEPRNDEEAPLPALVEQLQQNQGLRVRLNHVLVSTFHVHVGPATPPRPAGPQEFPDVPAMNRAATAAHPVKVRVLDTGLADDEVIRNQILQGRCDGDPKAAELSSPLPRSVGHGTFIAGLICQHSDGTRVEIRDVVDECGFIDDAALCGQLADIREDVDLLNLSLGGYGLGGDMVATVSQLKALTFRNPNLVIVAAAGNDGLDRPFLPAALPNVIGVAAVERGADGSLQRACFSNHGPWVDASAVGVGVVSAFPPFSGELAAVEPPPSCQGSGASVTAAPTSGSFEQRRARWSGTSFAAPLVTAAIAQRMTTAGRTAREAAYDLLFDPAVQGGRLPGLGIPVVPPRPLGPGADR
jgi:subtilisin family serine protease